MLGVGTGLVSAYMNYGNSMESTVSVVKWHCVTVSITRGGNVLISWDGVTEFTAVTPNSTVVDTLLSFPMYGLCSVNDLVSWNTALTSAEMTAYYNLTKGNYPTTGRI